MTLPAFASPTALGVRLGVTLSGADLARAQAALDDASALIRSTSALDWTDVDDATALADDVPAIVAVVCLAMAERKYRNPEGLRSESLGSYAAAYGSDPGMYLTPNEAALIRKAAGISSVGSVEMEGPFRVPIDYTTVPVDRGGDDLPWVTIGDEGNY